MYVRCINDGAVPCISNAVDLLKHNECQRALEAAVAVFEHMMNEYLKGRIPVEHKIIAEIQGAAHQAALDEYKKGALFDEGQEYTKKLAVSCTLVLCELIVPLLFFHVVCAV